MGCDIHLYSETLDENGNWVADQADSFSIKEENGYKYTDMDEAQGNHRNYWLFGVLANGVRTEWPYAYEVRGFPYDASEEVTVVYESWGSDAHSASYLTKRELQEKAVELMISHEDGARENAGYLQHIISGLEGDPDRQRIVFWFDN